MGALAQIASKRNLFNLTKSLAIPPTTSFSSPSLFLRAFSSSGVASWVPGAPSKNLKCNYRDGSVVGGTEHVGGGLAGLGRPAARRAQSAAGGSSAGTPGGLLGSPLPSNNA